MADFRHPLVLTSPLTKGERVRVAQRLLAGRGRVLKRKVYHGAIDGQYGPQCAGATKQAKYWIGYPKRKCGPAFGEDLYEYLTKQKKLSGIMRWRIRHREKIAKKQNLHKRVLALEEHFVGVKESPPGSNRQMFGAWYGLNGAPWCAIFQSYALSHCGRPFRYSYVPAIVSDARMGRSKLRVIPYSAISGSIAAGHVVLACFDWNHDGTADHVGMVSRVVSGTTFATVEGNTGETNFSNGGEVMRATRYTNQVQVFVEVLG